MRTRSTIGRTASRARATALPLSVSIFTFLSFGAVTGLRAGGAAGGLVLAQGVSALGQADTASPAGTRRVSLKPKKEPSLPPPKAATKAGGDVAGGLKPKGPAPDAAASKSAVAKNPAPGGAAEGTPQAEEAGGSFVDGLVGFIRAYAAWILIGLGSLLAAVLAWAFLVSRGKPGAGESAFAELGLADKTLKPAGAPAGKFSSTKIQAADVNDRLSRSVKTTEVETDREYALVVDEEALKMPPLPEEAADRTGLRSGVHSQGAPNRPGDAAAIQRLLEARNYKEAYDEYVRQIESAPSSAFQGEVEHSLGEHLIRSKELAKAARVLEHHVATHARKEVRPDVFFNLGYIHLLNRTFGKSRRYLSIFVETEKNPAYVARARKILEKIKSSPAKN